MLSVDTILTSVQRRPARLDESRCELVRSRCIDQVHVHEKGDTLTSSLSETTRPLREIREDGAILTECRLEQLASKGVRRLFSMGGGISTMILLIVLVRSSVPMTMAFSTAKIGTENVLHIMKARSASSSMMMEARDDVHHEKMYKMPLPSFNTKHGAISKATPLTASEERELLTIFAEGKRIQKIKHDLEQSGDCTRGRRGKKQQQQQQQLQIKLQHRINHISDAEWARKANISSIPILLSKIRQGKLARETLILRNMRLVHSIASKYSQRTTKQQLLLVKKQPQECCATATTTSSSSSSYYDDLVQEGVIGLSRAIDKYNLSLVPSNNNNNRNSNTNNNNCHKLSTYATYWIRAYITRAISTQDDLIPIPEYIKCTMSNIDKAAHRLGIVLFQQEEEDGGGKAFFLADLTTTLTNDVERELAIEACITVKKLRDVIRVSSTLRNKYQQRHYVTSLDEQPWLLDIYQSKRTLLQQQQSTNEHLQQHTSFSLSNSINTVTSEKDDQVQTVLSRYLRPKEIQALSLRYGLCDTGIGSSVTTAATTATNPIRPFRDYEAEAELELFGIDNGILTESDSSTMADAKNLHSITNNAFGETVHINNEKRQSTELKKGTWKLDNVLDDKEEGGTRIIHQHQLLPKRGRWGEAMTFQEVGKRMAISAEYGRRLCSGALEKLRKAAQEGQLQPEFLMT